jgi:hypothetical protein
VAGAHRSIWEVSVKMLIAAISMLLTSPAWGHHSYAMFDGSKTLTVSGAVAKLEWSNPHVFIWIYVPSPRASTGYDLYGFSTASTNVLSRNGWSPSVLKVGEKVSVDYWPLKDGRTGGQFIRAVHEDGHVTWGRGGPNGVNDPREVMRER